MSAGIFAGVIATQVFALGLSQRGTDGSNPSPSGRESTANPTSSKRRPGQPRSFETGAGERMHTFPSARSVSISSSIICDSYTVSWLATHRVARRGDNALLYAIGRASPHYGPPPGVAIRPPWSIGFKMPTNRHPGGGTSVPATRRPAFEGQSAIGDPTPVRDPRAADGGWSGVQMIVGAVKRDWSLRRSPWQD